MRCVSVMLLGAMLASGAVADPGRGGDKQQPVGAAARAKHGPEPLARPPEDVGMAEDPAPASGNQPVPQPPHPDASGTPPK